MSNEDTLRSVGKILDGPAERDAVHFAVAPVSTDEMLSPGQHIGITRGKATAAPDVPCVGIVDPFLRSRVMPGDRFWLFLYPGSITSLRHEWTHSAFSEAPTVEPPDSEGERSIKWMADFAEQYGFTGSRMMEAARDYLRDGEYFCDGGTFEGEYVPDEFWTHYQNITGEKIDPERRNNFFTCAC